MIQFCTGIPGSGKSYYGIFNIAINFAKDLKDNKKFKSYALSKTKYKTCLTNINELKFDKFDNVKELDFSKFKITLSKLHNLYKLGKSDTELEECVKDEDFFYSLIVVDECHNFLNKDDEVLVWWLSYHRHFFQDIILITQDIPLVNKKYKSFTEFYYKAIPSSRKIFNFNMIYHQYSGYQMFKTQKITSKKLPILKDIFALYGSGENNKQKSIILYFLLLALGFALATILVFYFFVNSKKSDSQNQNTQPLYANSAYPVEQQIPEYAYVQSQNTQLSTPGQENLKLFKFNCFEQFCYYKNDKSNSFEIPLNILREYLLDIDINKQFSEIKNNRLFIHVLADENKFNFLKVVRNEKNSNDMLSFGSFPK